MYSKQQRPRWICFLHKNPNRKDFIVYINLENTLLGVSCIFLKPSEISTLTWLIGFHGLFTWVRFLYELGGNLMKLWFQRIYHVDFWNHPCNDILTSKEWLPRWYRHVLCSNGHVMSVDQNTLQEKHVLHSHSPTQLKETFRAFSENKVFVVWREENFARSVSRGPMTMSRLWELRSIFVVPVKALTLWQKVNDHTLE